ncbi:MAG: PEGA domain-containing protein [Phycisphaerae bacterium]|nr:PEGA domain-containing protein [Phycisphaerae bacterium]
MAPRCKPLIAPALLLALPGCLSRTMVITSQPPGATVFLNEVEVGRTPLQTEFEWYGVYDVRLRLDGFEPVVTSRKASTPIHELPGIDFFATLAPVSFKHQVRWHFDLAPSPERSMNPEALDASLLERARETRGRVDPPAAP